jgi:zinc protease
VAAVFMSVWLSAIPPAIALSPAGREAARPEAAAGLPVRPERLGFRQTTLPNGLKVITLEDRRAPVVTVQVWYRVGSKDEAAGKSGFAHLFEHLMFKGSKNLGPEEHTRLVEQIGGDYNAGTSFDFTVYYETVPSNALDRVLFLEADRMSGLRVDETNLRSERDVVKEEYRTRVANAPYGEMFTEVLKLLFPERHPYAHRTIGSIPDLDAAKLDEVRAFHDEYYKPDNATLVLVGDFNTNDALANIRRYFGDIPKSQDGKFTRYPVIESRQTAERRETFYDRLAPLPAAGMAFRLPPASHADTPALTVVSQILSTGQSSRLYRSLVREKQIAVEAEGENVSLRLGGLFFFFAVAAAGKEPVALEAALRAEVERLRNEPVTADELAKAKNQVLTREVFGRISTENKANALGQAEVVYGDPEEANREFDKIRRVTAADVQRVARQYFAPGQTNVFHVLPESRRPKTNTNAAAAPVAANPAQEKTAR